MSRASMDDDEQPQLYGLDKELAEKRAAKYDPKREAEAQAYLEQLAGQPFAGASFHESLKDGVLLCKAMNTIVPEMPIKIVVSKMPFKQMENIGAFLDRMEKVGVPAHERFLTVDLYEAKDLNQVVNSIFSLSRHAAKRGFQGTVLGPKLTEKNERQFTEEQLRQAAAMPSKLMSFSTSVSSGLTFSGRREIGGKYLDKGPSEEDVAGAAAAVELVKQASPGAPPKAVEAVTTDMAKVSVSLATSQQQQYSAPAARPSTTSQAPSSPPPAQYQMQQPHQNSYPAAPQQSNSQGNHQPRPSTAAIPAPRSNPPSGPSSPIAPASSMLPPSSPPQERRAFTPRRPSEVPTRVAAAAPTPSSSAPMAIPAPAPAVTPSFTATASTSDGARPTLSITQFRTYAEYKAAKAALDAQYGPAASASPAASSPAVTTSSSRSFSRERPARGSSSRSSSQHRNAGADGGRRRVEIVREAKPPQQESDDEVAVFED